METFTNKTSNMQPTTFPIYIHMLHFIYNAWNQIPQEAANAKALATNILCASEHLCFCKSDNLASRKVKKRERT